jgi:hypothetical protein
MDNLEGIDIVTTQCWVCSKGFEGGDSIRLLPCRHIFHIPCTTLWLCQHASCPQCHVPVKFARDFKIKELQMATESVHSDIEDTQPILESRPEEVESEVPPPYVDGS